MRKFFVVIILIIYTYLPCVWANTKFNTYTEGVFKIAIPSNFTKLTGKLLDEFKEIMIKGGQELARVSKTADPNEINEQQFCFFSVFHNPTGKLLVVLTGYHNSVIMDRDEMYKINAQRIAWGIKSGRLSSSSKGVSKLIIDNIPCLLMDIEAIGGARMLTYLFFVPEYPKHSFVIDIICENSSCYEENKNVIATIVNSIKIIRKEY